MKKEVDNRGRWGRKEEQPFGRNDFGRGFFNRDEQIPMGSGQSARYLSDHSGSSRGATMPRGQHTGRGPKGYLRSDESLKEAICEVLTEHGDIDASEIEVFVEHGEVTLKGTVDERRVKRLAEDCVEEISGVKQVHNQIRVATLSHQRPETESRGQKPELRNVR